MKNFLPILFAALAVSLAGCSSTSERPQRQRPYVPRVSAPTQLNEHESRYLSDVEDVLVNAGYRPVHGSQPTEYQLEFTVDAGPVNADTVIGLTRGSQLIARSTARVGGPRMILRRSQVIQESVDKCLDDFQGRIPPPGGNFGGQNLHDPTAAEQQMPDQDWSGGGTENYGNENDWQQGWQE